MSGPDVNEPGATDPEAAGPTLDWPPPGLESLHGRIGPLARRLGVASALAVGPLLWIGTAGPGGVDFQLTRTNATLQLTVVLIATAILVSCASSLWVLGGRVTACVHRGYSWRTVIETIADSEGDTGSVIAGSGAYAMLTPGLRSRIRTVRLLRAAGSFVAAFLPVGMFLAVSLAASSSATMLQYAPIVVFAPSIVLLALNAAARRYERSAIRQVRTSRDRALFQPGASTRIIEPWYAALARAEGAPSAGRRRRGGSLYGLFAGGLTAAAVLCTAMIVAPVLGVAANGAAHLSQIPQRSGSTAARVARAERMRSFMLPADSSITASRAGEALFTLAPFERQFQRGPDIKPPSRTLEPLPAPDGAGFGPASGTYARLQLVVLRLATRSLTATERAFLAEVASHPAWEEYSIVARAPDIALADAVFVLPLAADVAPRDVRSDFLGATAQYSYANVSRAAWHLANGRRADAERTLREGVSFGLRVMDNAHMEAGVSVGAAIVSASRNALVLFYGAIGDSARAEQIALLEGNPRDVPRIATLADRAALLRGLTDRTTPRGVRWELVRLASLSVCGNARELLFGPSPALQRALESARTALVRTSAEAALFELQSEVVGRTALRQRRPGFASLARVPAVLLGNPRIAQCAVAWR